MQHIQPQDFVSFKGLHSECMILKLTEREGKFKEDFCFKTTKNRITTTEKKYHDFIKRTLQCTDRNWYSLRNCTYNEDKPPFK